MAQQGLYSCIGHLVFHQISLIQLQKYSLKRCFSTVYSVFMLIKFNLKQLTIIVQIEALTVLNGLANRW